MRGKKALENENTNPKMENIKCPKCGNTGKRVAYASAFGSECLVLICYRCGYDWKLPCGDYGSPEDDDE